MKHLKEQAPRRALVMSVAEETKIEDARIHVRGSVHTLGAVVPRGFLSVAEQRPSPALPSAESGRRELADWLASRWESDDRPRVRQPRLALVVRSGARADDRQFRHDRRTSSHPALLDDLASRFMEEDWSIKTLVRRIVTSHTYRISTEETPESRVLDPENRLLVAREPAPARRRMLTRRDCRSAAGARAGDGWARPFRTTSTPIMTTTTNRRAAASIRLVFRNALPEVFEAFDFADPSLVVGRREASTVAPQALFLINHPFVLAQARDVATFVEDRAPRRRPRHVGVFIGFSVARRRSRNGGSP